MTNNHLIMVICLPTIFLALVFVLILKNKKFGRPKNIRDALDVTRHRRKVDF